MDLNSEHVIAPKGSHHLVLVKGQHLRVIDLEGKQVVDMGVFNKQNLREKLSTSYSRTRGYRGTELPGLAATLGEGDQLMSTIANPMLTIVKETAEPKRVHDFHVRMCDRKLYASHGLGERDGCLDNIANALAPWGIMREDLPDPMNIFMNMPYDAATSRWIIQEPVTKAGDYIEFRAEMDLVIGFSNCPDTIYPVNGYRCTPVKIEVYGSGRIENIAKRDRTSSPTDGSGGAGRSAATGYKSIRRFTAEGLDKLKDR
jgi:uncharacterized protein YcgI (DUF1989 family)